MLYLSSDKLNLFFEKASALRNMYVPVDDTNGGASYKKWEPGITVSKALHTTRSAKAAMDRMSRHDSDGDAPASEGDAAPADAEKSDENTDNRIWRHVISRRSREQAKALYDKTAALFTDKFKS